MIDNPKGHCWRFDTIEEFLDDKQGQLTVAGALSLLEEVSQPNSQWSIVYDNGDLDLAVVMDRNYDDIYEYQLAVP